MVKNNARPKVTIIEQPLSRGARFRYECEGRYSESLLGVSSTLSNKTYPSIEITNRKGAAFVVVSCVTKDPPYRPHPHNLVGKAKDLAQGICYFKVPPDQTTIVFQHLGVQCVKRKDIEKSLTERERLKVDPFKTGFAHKYQPENIDLTAIRLCFQVFLEDLEGGNFTVPIAPIISNPIYDKKAAAELSICWLSHASATVEGGKTMCILCDKISKDDIQVRFFHEENGWEVIAESTAPHYHKQVAIIFKSPKYLVQDIDEPVLVHLQLKRPSDGETSRPLPFQLLPLEVDDHDLLKRKRQKLNETPKSLVLKHLQAEAAQKAKLGNLAKPLDSGVIKNRMRKPSPPVTRPLIHQKVLSSNYSEMSNNLNIYNEELTQTQQCDSVNNSRNCQQPNLEHCITTARRKHNLLDKLNMDMHQHQGTQNIMHAQQNNLYMDELLTTITDENLPNNFLISGDL